MTAAVGLPAMGRTTRSPEVPADVRVPVAAVLIVADPGTWAEELCAYLTEEGFDVVLDSSGDHAIDRRAEDSDVLIVRLDLSARSGAEVCRLWNQHGGHPAPLLAVAPTADEQTVLAAYEAGADQYAAAGISHRQLVARLRSLLRRMPARRRMPLRNDATIALNAEDCVAVVSGTRVWLTESEYRILDALLRRAGGVVTRRDLAMTAFRTTGVERTRSVDFTVRRLREKLEAVDGRRRIVAIRGVGFCVELDASVGDADHGQS